MTNADWKLQVEIGRGQAMPASPDAGATGCNCLDQVRFTQTSISSCTRPFMI